MTTTGSPGDAREGVRIAAGADVHDSATIGAGTSVWHHAAVREDVTLGHSCIVGRGAYLGPGVRAGDNVKIQNYALVYEPAVLGDGAFVGPGVVFTNDLNPRSVTPEGRLKNADDWHAVGVTVLEGGSVGARSVCVAPVTIGRWAMVAAGAVVTRDVPDFALVLGVPARQAGWVGRAGERLLDEGDGRFVCPATGAVYVEKDGVLSELAGTGASAVSTAATESTKTDAP